MCKHCVRCRAVSRILEHPAAGRTTVPFDTGQILFGKLFKSFSVLAREKDIFGWQSAQKALLSFAFDQMKTTVETEEWR